MLDRLSLLKPEDQDAIARLSGGIRDVIASSPMPRDIRAEIADALSRLGP